MMVGTHRAEPSAKEMKKGMEEMKKQQLARAVALSDDPSFEKHRLCQTLFWFGKVAQPHADEPVLLLRREIDVFSQLQHYGRQLLARRRRRCRRMAASENFEVAGLQLQNYRTRSSGFLT